MKQYTEIGTCHSCPLNHKTMVKIKCPWVDNLGELDNFEPFNKIHPDCTLDDIPVKK